VLLLREVHAWLRYRLNQCPIAMANGIVTEELPETSLDEEGSKRLFAIYGLNGMSKRIEVRFSELRPQVWLFNGANDDKEYLLTPVPRSGVPGDNRAMDCSDFVEALYQLTLLKLCNSVQALYEQVSAKLNEVNAFTPLKWELMDRVIQAVHRSVKTSKPLMQKTVIKFLKEQGVGGSDPLMTFAHSVVYFFKQGKVKWEDIDVLESEFPPGKDIVPWDFFKAQLNDPALRGKLTPEALERIAANASPFPRLQQRLDRMIETGEPLNQMVPKVRFGEEIIAQLSDGRLPLPYIQLMEAHDPKEKILPWSFIRRRVIAEKLVIVPQNEGSLVDAIMDWLKGSSLLLPLYNGEEAERSSLELVVKHQLAAAIKQTLENAVWVRNMADSVGGASDKDQDKNLQVEFDLWLLDALSPQTGNDKLPLSPHSFSKENRGQKDYAKMFALWRLEIKKQYLGMKEASVVALRGAIDHFYKEVASKWKGQHLLGYRPRVPPAGKIALAAREGNRAGLLALLLEDIEGEMGHAVPADVRQELLDSPYFNSIYKETRFQGAQI